MSATALLSVTAALRLMDGMVELIKNVTRRSVGEAQRDCDLARC